MQHYDVIVMGIGGMGSAALYSLARRGLKVCGVERFGVAHDRGSSHGDTRIIRKAYLEHPDYVPLLHRAYDLWEELERSSGRELLVKTGILVVGQAQSTAMRGLEVCYQQHQLPHEWLDIAAVKARFPQWHLAAGNVALVDPLGGFLRVEDCIEQQVDQALKCGAQLYADEPVRAWKREGGGIAVETVRRTLTADKLIIATGAWARPELANLGVELQVVRKVLFWYAAPDDYRVEHFPCFIIEKDEAIHYGFPTIDRWGLKAARHSPPHQVVDNPAAVERNLMAGDEDLLLQVLEEYLPGLKPQRTRHEVCMYTVTADENFILDVHPECDNVVLGVGFSGHGFKFSSVIGEILGDLAIEGKTRHPIDFLRLDRLL